MDESERSELNKWVYGVSQSPSTNNCNVQHLGTGNCAKKLEPYDDVSYGDL